MTVPSASLPQPRTLCAWNANSLLNRIEKDGSLLSAFLKEEAPDVLFISIPLVPGCPVKSSLIELAFPGCPVDPLEKPAWLLDWLLGWFPRWPTTMCHFRAGFGYGGGCLEAPNGGSPTPCLGSSGEALFLFLQDCRLGQSRCNDVFARVRLF